MLRALHAMQVVRRYRELPPRAPRLPLPRLQTDANAPSARTAEEPPASAEEALMRTIMEQAGYLAPGLGVDMAMLPLGTVPFADPGPGPGPGPS